MERPRWGNRCTGRGKKRKQQHIYSARGENVWRLLKGADCPRRGRGARAGEQPRSRARRRGSGSTRAMPFPGRPRGRGGTRPGANLEQPRRDAGGRRSRRKHKGGCGDRGGGCPRPGRPPSGRAGAPQRGRGCGSGRACPAARARLGRRMGKLELALGAPGSLPGCKFLVSGFSEPVGTWASLGRQEEGAAPLPSLFPSLPPCICPGSRRAEGRGLGGRGPVVPCPARPGRSSPAFVRGSGEALPGAAGGAARGEKGNGSQ